MTSHNNKPTTGRKYTPSKGIEKLNEHLMEQYRLRESQEKEQAIKKEAMEEAIYKGEYYDLDVMEEYIEKELEIEKKILQELITKREKTAKLRAVCYEDIQSAKRTLYDKEKERSRLSITYNSLNREFETAGRKIKEARDRIASLKKALDLEPPYAKSSAQIDPEDIEVDSELEEILEEFDQIKEKGYDLIKRAGIENKKLREFKEQVDDVLSKERKRKRASPILVRASDQNKFIKIEDDDEDEFLCEYLDQIESKKRKEEEEEEGNKIIIEVDEDDKE